MPWLVVTVRRRRVRRQLWGWWQWLRQRQRKQKRQIFWKDCQSTTKAVVVDFLLTVQSFEPLSRNLPAHAGVPVWTDHCDRRQTSFCATYISNGTKRMPLRRETRSKWTLRVRPPQGRMDWQPGHTWGHLRLSLPHRRLLSCLLLACPPCVSSPDLSPTIPPTPYHPYHFQHLRSLYIYFPWVFT